MKNKFILVKAVAENQFHLVKVKRILRITYEESGNRKSIIFYETKAGLVQSFYSSNTVKEIYGLISGQ